MLDYSIKGLFATFYYPTLAKRNDKVTNLSAFINSFYM